MRSGRVNADEKQAIVLLGAHTPAIHPRIAHILARAVMIARYERDASLPQQWRKNVAKKCVLGVSAFMRDIARHDDMVHVIEHEPLDERFRALRRGTKMQVGQMSQSSIDHETNDA